MRTIFLAVATTLLMGGVSAMAAPPESAQAMMQAKMKAEAPKVLKAELLSPSFSLSDPGRLSTRSDSKLKSKVKAAGRKSIASTSELVGPKVMTYQSLTQNNGDDGTSATVTAIAGTDSIAIENFWGVGVTAKAYVDKAAGNFTIPAQYLYNHTTYGAMWLALCTPAGKPDYTQSLQGKILADGTLSISSWWGVFVKEGTQKDAILYAGHDAMIIPANGTMSCTPDGSTTPTTYNVVVSQKFLNMVEVINFGNHGQTVNIDLNSDFGGNIPQQSVYNYPDNGDFFSFSYTEYSNVDGKISISGLNADIALNKAASATVRELSWGKWTAMSRSQSKSLLLGAWSSTTLKSNVDIKFPSVGSTSFAGSGTEADPYQIKSVDDLVLLSTSVNSFSEMDADKNYYAYKGKYFKLMNDIDMSNYKFTPIGNDYYHYFAGNFDGNGKTITGPVVSSSTGFCGLFGMVAPNTTISNLTVKDPNVTGAGTWVAAVVGYSKGTLDNIKVVGGTVINQGSATGALAGSGTIITNCHVDGTGVLGTSGWIGGLTGEIYTSISNSDVVNSKVIGAPGTGRSLGGVVGSIYGSGSNLYFKGSVDGLTLRAADGTGIQAGGVVGSISGKVVNGEAVRNSLTNSFATGTVSGYGSYCAAGGIIGNAQGVSVENCYFHGDVTTTFSRKTGGLVGYVGNALANGTAIKNDFKNLYTVSTITAEDYQYNKLAGWIETLGQVEEGALNDVKNICYDKQVYSHNSFNAKGLTTSEMTSASGINGFSADAWTFTANQYPRLKFAAESEAAKMSASAVLFTGTSAVKKVNVDVALSPMGQTQFMLLKKGELSKEGYFCSIEGNTLKIKDEFGTDTLVCVNGKAQYAYFINVAPVSFDGLGTEDNPYKIATKADLISLSQFVTLKKQYFPGTYFLQTSDIDLELDSAFIGLATDADDAHSQFAGIYDGGNHTIHRMKVLGLYWKTAPSEANNWIGTPSTSAPNKSTGYKGFIGRLHTDGVLRNLNFAADCDATTSVWASAGLAVGDNNGLVENVRNYADIRGISCWIGGLVGMNEKSGIIRNCYNAGNAESGYNTVGGIAGKNDGLIENCANAGNVSVKKLANFGRDGMYNTAAGIAPTMSGGRVVNVLNVGTISAQDDAAGGIIGSLGKASATAQYKNDVIGALNIGTVRVGNPATIGAIGGLGSTANGVITDGTVTAYFDKQIVPYLPIGNKDYKGAVGLLTDSLISGNAIAGLDAEFWQFDKGSYPVLKSFANEPKLQAARKMLLLIPGDVTLNNLSVNATMASGFDWSLSNSDYFKINGQTLTSGEVPEKVITAVLTSSNADFSRPFDLRRAPSVPLQGQGTAESPYLITSVADWNNLSDYISNVNDHFADQYLKVTADLNFDGNFKTLFFNTVDQLDGTLDGDNHTISGVSFTPTDRYQGAIANIGPNGTLCNFTFKGSVTSAKPYVGGVTGKVYGTLRNVTSEMDVTLTSGSGASAFGSLKKGAVLEKVVNKGTITAPSTYVAGIAAEAETGVTFTECGNEGTIHLTYDKTSTSTAMSIGGLVASTGPNVFTDCYNKGKFEFAKTVAIFGVGGLIGTSNGDSGEPEGLRMTGCYNTADITGGWLLGGIVGSSNHTTAAPNPIKLTRCYNTGNITSEATASKTSSALAGLLPLYTPGTVVDSCYNTGNITQCAKATYAAGLVGYYKTNPTEAAPMIVRNSWNSGAINAAGNQGGGIVAYVNAYSTVADCYNTGTISGGFGLGGICAALANATAKVERCWNSGKISTQKNRAGGIVGYNTVAASITDCFNYGEVELTIDPVTATNGNLTDGYGAGGIAGAAGATLTRCYNMGTISGKSQVGGLVGQTTKARTSFVSCYNAGAIVAPADTCGSIVGVAIENNGKYWNADNNVTDCYFIDRQDANDKIGTAVDEAKLASTDMGEGWLKTDNYTYPLLADNCTDQARVGAARVILSEEDRAKGIVTGTFYLGCPEGLVWTSSISDINIAGTEAIWKKAFNGDFTMTATCGDFSRTVDLNASVESGITSVADGKVIVSEVYYTTGGVRVARPEMRDGNVYIVVRRYDDGTSTTVRVMN